MRDSAETETVLFVTDHHGRKHTLAALDGWRVMEVIRDWGVEVAAECGGCRLMRNMPRLAPGSEKA